MDLTTFPVESTSQILSQLSLIHFFKLVLKVPEVELEVLSEVMLELELEKEPEVSFKLEPEVPLEREPEVSLKLEPEVSFEREPEVPLDEKFEVCEVDFSVRVILNAPDFL
jgi:hypothetical protein